MRKFILKLESAGYHIACKADDKGHVISFFFIHDNCIQRARRLSKLWSLMPRSRPTYTSFLRLTSSVWTILDLMVIGLLLLVLRLLGYQTEKLVPIPGFFESCQQWCTKIDSVRSYPVSSFRIRIKRESMQSTAYFLLQSSTPNYANGVVGYATVVGVMDDKSLIV